MPYFTVPFLTLIYRILPFLCCTLIYNALLYLSLPLYLLVLDLGLFRLTLLPPFLKQGTFIVPASLFTLLNHTYRNFLSCLPLLYFGLFCLTFSLYHTYLTFFTLLYHTYRNLLIVPSPTLFWLILPYFALPLPYFALPLRTFALPLLYLTFAMRSSCKFLVQLLLRWPAESDVGPFRVIAPKSLTMLS